MLDGGDVIGADDFDQRNADMRDADASFLHKLRQEKGEVYPCGHAKSWRNTQTVNGKQRCRTCRRERWNKGFRLAVIKVMGRRMESAEKKAKIYKIGRDNLAADVKVLSGQLSVAESKLATYEPVKGRGDAKRLPLVMLRARVASSFDITVGELMGSGRSPTFVHARAVIVRILLERGLSLAQCAKAIGRVDHSTAHNLKANFDRYCVKDGRVTDAYYEYRDEVAS